jgi:protoporphyrinogen/coproporphyrinogen III oxidase
MSIYRPRPSPQRLNKRHWPDIRKGQIDHLGLAPQIVATPSTAPAARNRFLHLPPRRGLAPLPASLAGLLRSELGRTLLVPAVARDLFRLSFSPSPPSASQIAAKDNEGYLTADAEAEAETEADGDESVHAFFARHFGDAFALTFASALVHGIYAADARALSLAATFPTLPDLARAGRGSVARGVLLRALSRASGEHKHRGGADAPDAVKGASVFSFREGMQALPDALRAALASAPNVRLVPRARATRLAHDARTDSFDVRRPLLPL